MFNVSPNDVGKRLDLFLVERLDGRSRQEVKALIDAGRVKVGGKKVVIAKWSLKGGDNVAVRLIGWVRPKKGKASGREPVANLFIKVVHQDRDVVVVEKPAGAVIQPGDKGGSSYVESLRAFLKRKHGGRGSFVKAVHRLDKDTTGLMVFATSKTGEKLLDQFKKHQVERSYLAIVNGRVPQEQGRINFHIEKGNFGYGKKVAIARKGDGLRAVTDYLVKERYEDATLIRLDLRTGRTHQARLHMAAIGHPIVGDKIYGTEGGKKFPRQALHSHHLIFKHPDSGKIMNFKSKLPPDLEKMVDKLRGE